MEQLTGFSYSVESVTRNKIARLGRQASNLIVLGEDNWVQSSDLESVAIAQTQTCASFYVFCPPAQEVLAAHFVPAEIHTKPETVEEFGPHLEYVIDLSRRWGILDSFSRYNSMLARTRYLVDRYGSGNVEAYLFGQHFGPETRFVGLTLVNRLNIEVDLKKQGIQGNKIADHRSLQVYRRAPTDFTLLHPQTGKIYLNRALPRSS